MKKLMSLIVLLGFCPFVSFAQSESVNYGSLFGALIGIGIAILVFLALRQLVLWYWKVEIIIQNQQEQTKGIQAIYNLLDENARYSKALLEEMKKQNEAKNGI
ncbi:hypothetical protein [Pedobacter roseus]|uniref:Uncharacterized protein n=1 Tax=Pedobacter roseus TaxID=336820 RepID=A0A7G9QDI3_9SPHI|nr:hypothetical protein [Pedobacter roseus]QNN41408.1 hypothetical protein H9L23_20160 [Pedobacter roseus]